MSAHTELGAWGEAYVAALLAQVAPVEPAQRADLRWMGLEIEVKTARPTKPTDHHHRRPRYQFLLRKRGHSEQRGDVVILVLADTRICYVLPAAVVGARRKLVLPVQARKDGLWAEYRERWDLLAGLWEAAHGLSL